MVDVPDVGTVEFYSWFRPTAVNNLGQVVGTSGGDGLLITVNSDGTYSIEESQRLWGFVPYAINDWGGMAGVGQNGAAIAWIENGVVQVQDLGLGAYSRAAGINNWGEVVGQGPNSHNYQPFLWQPSVGITWLTPDSRNPGVALDINDQGQVVGWSFDSNLRRYAFLWENGKLSDLNVLSGAGTKKFRLGSADAINNAGQIVGSSDFYSGTNWAGTAGSYLLTPK
jgi:probable HAF family extracellular repeat protein